MSIQSVKTNLQALRVQDNLRNTQSTLSTTIERLSSGLRVNSAKDDAAGQAIANRMTTLVRGQNMAARNANDGISMAATAESYLDAVNQRLQRVRELTVQGLNGSYSPEDKDQIQTEINLNFKEIDRINSLATFNGLPLLNGEAGSLNLQVGAGDNDVLQVDLGGDGFDINSLGLLDFTIQGEATKTLTAVDVIKGEAVKIPLARSTVTYVPADNSPELVKGMMENSFRGDLYMEKDNGGRLFNRSVTARHDTDTLENTVTISKRTFGNYENRLSSDYPLTFESGAFQNQDGAVIDLPNQKLVHIGGKHYIRSSALTEGPYTYYEAELDYKIPETSTYATVTKVKMVDGVEKSQEDLGTQSTGDGSQYIPSSGDINHLSGTTFQIDGSEAPKDQYSLVNLNGYYYLETKEGDDYKYFKAEVSITNRGRDNQTILVKGNSSGVLATELQEEVSGNSTIHLKPENGNVKVNYKDQMGITHEDILTSDQYGNYEFLISGSKDSPHKRGTLVQDTSGNYFLKTIDRGEAELYLYYPVDAEQVKDNGRTNVGESDRGLTTITFTEGAEVVRFRTPEDPLGTLDRALNRVDEKRSHLGAIQNRLESTISSLTNSSNNLSAARSRIIDADYAIEVSNMTRAQILQQASTAVLAQANQIPNTVLSLLG